MDWPFWLIRFFCVILPQKEKAMKIFGVVGNYREHIAEMGNIGTSSEPVVFTKCDSALVNRGRPFFIPDFTWECEYETELVVRISRMGRSISQRFAHRYYDAVTVGIDFTARDIQRRMRERGLPWDLAKGFDGSAVIGEWREFSQLPNRNPVELSNISDLLKAGMEFRLDINGTTVQSGISSQMIHDADRLVSYISSFFTLKTGDMIFTGTPVGVGPVHIDDHLTGYLDGDKVLEFNVK